VIVSSGSTGNPITRTVGTAAITSNTACASATEANLCLGTTNVVAVGAGVGVSLGTMLVTSLVALAVLVRRQKSLRSELARAQDLSAGKHERPMQTYQKAELHADSTRELDGSNK
jgi:hypothetical protein